MQRAARGGGDRGPAIERVAVQIDDPAEQLTADRDGEQHTVSTDLRSALQPPRRFDGDCPHP
jgi:hypothetical protein